MMTQLLTQYGIHEVLVDFARGKKTGFIDMKPYSRKLFFEEGELVFAKSTVDEESFSHILVEMGQVDADDLQAVRRELRPGDSLGKILREKGLTTAADLGMALKQQIMRIIKAVVATESCECEVFEGELKAKMPKLKINTYALIAKNVLLIEDESFPQLDAQSIIHLEEDDFDSIIEHCNLPPHFRSVMAALSSGMVAEEVPLGVVQPEQFYRLLYVLEKFGALRLEAPASESPSPPLMDAEGFAELDDDEEGEGDDLFSEEALLEEESLFEPDLSQEDEAEESSLFDAPMDNDSDNDKTLRDPNILETLQRYQSSSKDEEEDPLDALNRALEENTPSALQSETEDESMSSGDYNLAVADPMATIPAGRRSEMRHLLDEELGRRDREDFLGEEAVNEDVTEPMPVQMPHTRNDRDYGHISAVADKPAERMHGEKEQAVSEENPFDLPQEELQEPDTDPAPAVKGYVMPDEIPVDPKTEPKKKPVLLIAMVLFIVLGFSAYLTRDLWWPLIDSAAVSSEMLPEPALPAEASSISGDQESSPQGDLPVSLEESSSGLTEEQSQAEEQPMEDNALSEQSVAALPEATSGYEVESLNDSPGATNLDEPAEGSTADSSSLVDESLIDPRPNVGTSGDLEMVLDDTLTQLNGKKQFTWVFMVATQRETAEEFIAKSSGESFYLWRNPSNGYYYFSWGLFATEAEAVAAKNDFPPSLNVAGAPWVRALNP